MPNHWTSILTVTGPQRELKRLIDRLPPHEKHETPIFDCDTFVPMPPELENEFIASDGSTVSIQDRHHPEAVARREENIENHGAPYWYQWRIHNWGTKWGAYSHDVTEVAGDEVTFRFESAWGPPDQAIVAASLQHPELVFELYGWDEFDDDPRCSEHEWDDNLGEYGDLPDNMDCHACGELRFDQLDTPLVVLKAGKEHELASDLTVVWPLSNR